LLPQLSSRFLTSLFVFHFNNCLLFHLIL
jgi:hypothetical protein